ncbi:MAG: GIY-YIG nuclease family protein [Patescibacteria group bacterium]
MQKKSVWSVYILRCADKTLYTGITKDLKKRITCHNTGKGAKYTRARLPVRLVHQEKMKNESAARKREAAIKKLKRKEKLKLTQRSPRRFLDCASLRSK